MPDRVVASGLLFGGHRRPGAHPQEIAARGQAFVAG